jgi:hypothetical protein
MITRILCVVVLLSSAVACDTKNEIAQQASSGDVCASERGDPSRLGSLLECMKNNNFQKHRGQLGDPVEVCRYLPEAIRYVRSNHHDEVKDYLLISAIEIPLPLVDYITAWAPAVKEGYLKGFVSDRNLIRVLFPYGSRAELYLAFDAPPVRHFYSSLLNEERIIALKIGGFRQWDTVEKHTRALLNGEAGQVIKQMAETGELGYRPDPADLTTTCAVLHRRSKQQIKN